jgi:DNA-binding MarR family transcriptional regulator/photosystem II stability/assembly factor-like uncharacterized protein
MNGAFQEEEMADPKPLPGTLSYLLAQVCKLHRQRAEDLLSEIGLHVGQEMVLCALWQKEGVTQTELGERLAVRPATVTNALRRLERKGLVRRVPDADDQRISRVFPTDEGRERRSEVEEQWSELERDTLAGFDDRARDLLRSLLSRVHENLAGRQTRRAFSTTEPTRPGMEPNHTGGETMESYPGDRPADIAPRPSGEETDRHLVLGTGDGVWRMSGDNAERIGLAGKIVVHVADRNGTVLAAVARDGVYEISDSGERRIWEGDARAAAIGPDGRFYVGTEPAMVFRSDDGGRTWRRSDKIDELPTREKWYFPGPPHQPHVRSIDFLPDAEASVLVGVEVGGVVYSPDYGDSWSELNNGLYVDVHTVRPDPSEPGRLIAATGKGLYLSENNGDSWQQITEGIGQGYTVGLHVNPERVGEVLIATGQRPPGISARVYHSLDGGRSWNQVVDPVLPEQYARVPVVIFAHGNAWIATDEGQVFRAEAAQTNGVAYRGPGIGGWSLVQDLPTSIKAASAGQSPSSVSSGFSDRF